MGSQKYAPALDVDIKRIAGAKAKFAAEGLRKNDLTLGGNLGLHGKTILPSFLPCRNQRLVRTKAPPPFVIPTAVEASAVLLTRNRSGWKFRPPLLSFHHSYCSNGARPASVIAFFTFARLRPFSVRVHFEIRSAPAGSSTRLTKRGMPARTVRVAQGIQADCRHRAKINDC